MNKINHIIRRHINNSDKIFRHCSRCKNSDLNTEKCKKFSEYDFIYDKYQQISINKCRRDEKKCGESAVFYEEMTEKEYNSKLVDWFSYNLVLPVSICGLVIIGLHL